MEIYTTNNIYLMDPISKSQIFFRIIWNIWDHDIIEVGNFRNHVRKIRNRRGCFLFLII